MNANANVSYIQPHWAHTHFYDYIESFHGQPEVNLASESTQRNDLLRNQLINGSENLESNLCMRNCYKLNQKRHIEFCLDRKCGGVDFQKAASNLGYKQ